MYFLEYIISIIYQKIKGKNGNLISGNYKKEQLKINYGIIFGLVMLSPVFLVGSIENIFGLIGGVLFTATFTALIVDSLYAAYYIHKYPEYEW